MAQVHGQAVEKGQHRAEGTEKQPLDRTVEGERAEENKKHLSM